MGVLGKRSNICLSIMKKKKRKNNKNNLEWTTHLPHHPVEHKQRNTCKEICLK